MISKNKIEDEESVGPGNYDGDCYWIIWMDLDKGWQDCEFYKVKFQGLLKQVWCMVSLRIWEQIKESRKLWDDNIVQEDLLKGTWIGLLEGGSPLL